MQFAEPLIVSVLAQVLIQVDRTLDKIRKDELSRTEAELRPS